MNDNLTTEAESKLALIYKKLSIEVDRFYSTSSDIKNRLNNIHYQDESKKSIGEGNEKPDAIDLIGQILERLGSLERANDNLRNLSSHLAIIA